MSITRNPMEGPHWKEQIAKKNTLENIEEENFVSVWSMTTLLIRAPNRSQNVERKETF